MRGSLPKLMDLYDEFDKQRDHFEIIAFHDPRAKTIAEIDQQLKSRNIIDGVWGGRNLPFPVLVDASRDTMGLWGIRFFPTVVLIDPEGNLVRGGNEEMLEQELRKLR